MPDLKKPPPPEKERVCGNCIYFHRITPEHKHHGWTGMWGCFNKDKNPDRRDPKEGIMSYNRSHCQFWEW